MSSRYRWPPRRGCPPRPNGARLNLRSPLSTRAAVAGGLSASRSPPRPSLPGLLLIQGAGDKPQPNAPAASSETATTDGADATVAVPAPTGSGKGEATAVKSGSAELVRGSAYSLALPPGWKQIKPEGGATFAAVAADGGADAQLWISEDPNLEYPSFVRQSLQQLETLAGSAHIVARVPAPTAEQTIVTIAADAPPGQPSYEVTLRVAGPYRYYLATSVHPDASREAVSGSELLSGSFTPEARG